MAVCAVSVPAESLVLTVVSDRTRRGACSVLRPLPEVTNVSSTSEVGGSKSSCRSSSTCVVTEAMTRSR